MFYEKNMKSVNAISRRLIQNKTMMVISMVLIRGTFTIFVRDSAVILLKRSTYARV